MIQSLGLAQCTLSSENSDQKIRYVCQVTEIFYARIIKGLGKIAPSISSGEKVIYGARDMDVIGETARTVSSDHRVGRVLSFSPVVGIGTPSLACGRGGGPNSDRGHTLWYSIYMCTLWFGRTGPMCFVFCRLYPPGISTLN
jgi:hypothetical protein